MSEKYNNQEELVKELASSLKKKGYFFAELLKKYSEVEYRMFLQAWSDIRKNYELERDKEGRYLIEEE